MNVLILLLTGVAVSLAMHCDQTTQNSPTEPAPVPTTFQTPTVWPQGSYSLPKTSSGCPGAEWSTGTFFQDTEDYFNGNTWNTTDMSGFSKKDGFMRSFCTKIESTTSVAGSWPAGSYCILKKGTCPSGFQEGSILWDDENNHNMNSVYAADINNLPDGEFTTDTKLMYCCREDGDAVTEIHLPTATPFYLLMKTNVCQNVAGMSVTAQNIKWDDEDTNNHNRRAGSTPFDAGNRLNIGINYCYYKPAAA